MTTPWDAYEKNWAFCQTSIDEGAPHKMPKTLLVEQVREGLRTHVCTDKVRCSAFIDSAREARTKEHAAKQ